jgi:3-oxoacyl-[acyl-carrier protein] reductase
LKSCDSSLKTNRCAIVCTTSTLHLTTAMLAHKVAVVTGAGRGIGLSIAKLLARQGASIVVNDLDAGIAEQAAASVRQDGAEAISVPGSVADDGFGERLAQETSSKFGRADILVNNAGMLWDGMLHTMQDDQWQKVLDVHATAPFRIIRAFAPLLRDAGKQEVLDGTTVQDRSIINVSSTSGLHGNLGQANYALAKAGILGLTKTVAKEWGPFGVRCNAVAFGMVDTRMTQSNDGDDSAADDDAPPQGLPPDVAAMWSSPKMLKMAVPLQRKGTPDEAAGAVLMLASPYASYITGATLECTGGMGI